MAALTHNSLFLSLCGGPHPNWDIQSSNWKHILSGILLLLVLIHWPSLGDLPCGVGTSVLKPENTTWIMIRKSQPGQVSLHEYSIPCKWCNNSTRLILQSLYWDTGWQYVSKCLQQSVCFLYVLFFWQTQAVAWTRGERYIRFNVFFIILFLYNSKLR